ncbi:Uncharacterized protein TCM_009023 [Theobroma cacao]|uniref:Uncharacterized protein n=1 Tax=Theobroma cacao TaxID=3641 RepID=A0A061E6G0_THECC|nr:Uncharacterized protein TCM_009023 [Theobroma cacao]
MKEMDDHGNVSEPDSSHADEQPHTLPHPELSIGLAEMHNGSNLSLSEVRKVDDGVVIVRHLRWVMQKHKRDMLELKGSIESLKDAKQTLEDHIVFQFSTASTYNYGRGRGNLRAVNAEGDSGPQSNLKGIASRSSSLDSSHVQHREELLPDPTERAQVILASKYFVSPYVDPLVYRQDMKNSMVEVYEELKKDEWVR